MSSVTGDMPAARGTLSYEDKYLTVPNVMTVAGRMILPFAAPLIMWAQEDPISRAFGFDFRLTVIFVAVLVQLSDLDGNVARWLKQESKLGAHLDPWSDCISAMTLMAAIYINAVSQNATVYALVAYGVPTVLIPYYAVRVGHLRTNAQIRGSSKEAKVKTVFLAVSFICIFMAAYLQSGWAMWVFETIGVICGWHALYMSHMSWQDYLRAARRRPSP